jgi:UDP-sugar pyrophosphorylase
VALPLYIVEREMCFLELYLSHISTIQAMHGNGRQLPVAIMTSDDTHALTVELLKKRNFFGMPEGQITIMKQNKVPAMLDATAKFAGKDGKIDTKPHGHGDVHTLLHQHAIGAWAKTGVKWVVFFQDTNGPIFRSMAAVLGVSSKLNLAANSVCVPRTPGKASLWARGQV